MKEAIELEISELNRQLERAQDILRLMDSPFPDRLEILARARQRQLIQQVEAAIEKAKGKS